MDSLIRLKLDSEVDLNILGDKLSQCSGCCLEYNSLENFKDTFGRFSGILFEHADKIKSIMSVTEGDIFQANVHIVSKIEDKFNVPVNNLFVSAIFERAIHEMSEFYYQDLCDGSFALDIINSNHRNPFAIIEWILTSNITQGTNLSIDMDNINRVWLEERDIFDSIYPYINSFIYKNYIQVIK